LISATSTITSAANISGANLTTGGIVSATGNIISGNLITTGTLSATGTGNNFMQGALGIGGNPSSAVVNLYAANPATSGLDNYGILQTSQISGGNKFYTYATSPSTAATAFTLTSLSHYRASQGTFGAGSTVTNQYGFFATLNLTGATNNYGFYSQLNAATGRYNFYTGGNADNLLNGNVYLGGGAAGAQSLLVAPTTSSVNYLQIAGGNTGNAVVLSAQGSDANVDIQVTPKGTGATRLLGGNGTGGISGPTSKVWASKIIMNQDADTYSGLSIQNRWASQTSTLLELAMGWNGTTAGYYPVFTVDGLGQVIFKPGVQQTERGRVDSLGIWSLGGAPGSESFQAYPIASSVNYLQAQGGTTGNPPALYAQGSDTNVGISYASKGSGTQTFLVGGYTAFRIDGGGASNQNFLQIYSGGSAYTLNFGGNDTNVNVSYASKGTGFHNFLIGGATQFLVSNMTSAVNYVLVYGGVTGSPATVAAQGSDTNVDLRLLPQGTGAVTTAAAFSATGNITSGNKITGNTLVTTPVPLANLTAIAGARAFVNNSNLAAAGNFGNQIAGTGSNTVPVWSNGTNWFIG
jgi:hypothetical protein